MDRREEFKLLIEDLEESIKAKDTRTNILLNKLSQIFRNYDELHADFKLLEKEILMKTNDIVNLKCEVSTLKRVIKTALDID